MQIPVKSEFELGADAVGAGHQHRIAVVFADFHQRAEAAQAAEHFGAQCALGKGFDVFDQTVAGVDVHTGVAVAQGSVHGCLSKK